MNHYVYIHRRNDDLSIFYVGKGKKRRAWSRQGRNVWWHRIVAKYGHQVEIVKDKIDEKEALELEIETISKFRNVFKLTNLVDGGGGTTGWKHSDEAKDKISAFNKGKKMSAQEIAFLIKRSTGKKYTAEQRQRMSDAKRGKPRGPLAEETKRKIAQSHRGVRPSEATLMKMSQSKIGTRVGKLSQSYDHAIRKFTHKDHGIFEGTRGDFIIEYNLANGCVSSMISGKQKSVKGWTTA